MSEKIPHQKLLKANSDPKRAASAAHLIYVESTSPGINRKKKGKYFIYLWKNKPVKDEKHLERIKKLAIPPSWKNVWICRSPQGHLQATGIDLRGRKQYRYHPEWNHIRTETKFHHLYEFGKMLPKLRRKIKHDTALPKLTQHKVLAAAIDLMEKTYIRIGNESYEKENGSYGLTTLKDQHVTIQKDQLKVSFNGKKGVKHDISLKNKKLAHIIKQCRDIPGKALFQYYDEENNRRSIDSTMLNHYLKKATSDEFTAKDIRTWAGSVQAINYYLSNENNDPQKKNGKNVVAMLDWVSEKLGNTRNVCKKYYVHPSLIAFCEQQKKLPVLKNNTAGFSKSEQLLMCILKNG